MVNVPKAFPKEFRNDVIAVARRGEAPISRIAKDFGVSESGLQRWLKIADVEDGIKPGVTQADATELREARRRIRLLEQDNEILRRAAAYLSQASLYGSGHLPAPTGRPCARILDERRSPRFLSGQADAKGSRSVYSYAASA